MENVGEFGRSKTQELSKLTCFILIGSFVLAVSSTKSDSPITTMNSSSIVYTSSSGKEVLVPDTMESELPKTLAQVALSPLLEASKKLFHHLPLESLFPQMRSSTNVTGNAQEHLNLTSALLNHSLHHHGTDDELDRIVFSNLPEGSKLVLKTVKLMKTDENGNEEPMGDPAISFNVLPIGSSRADTEETEEESDEVGSVIDNKDLTSDASSHKAGYDSYGRNEKEKEKKENQHHGQTYGQDHKETLTDSKGKKVTNYKGREKGLTDFDHVHGNSQSNDGERFKNSKKKNKGRKVTGFKRVYHKEEFQRTEHFYDDEEAKKIAESYGLGDAKEKKEHGKKEDDRKYHGDRIEHSGGEKVKNEHATHQGHHKGYNVAHENTDKHKQGHHYSSHQHTPQSRHPVYQQQQYHPNHRYNGAYSQPQLNYNPGPASAQGTGVVSPAGPRTPFGPKLKLNPSTISTRLEMPPPSGSKPTTPSPPPLDETRIFRAQTNRFSPQQQLSYYYAPNFGPTSTTDRANPGNYFRQNNNYGGPPRGNGTRMVTTPRTRMNGAGRYAGTYRRPLTFDSPQYNSPIPKNPAPFPPYYPPVRNGQNLISIDKAVVTKVAPPHSYSRGPNPREVFFSSGYTNWRNPLPSGSVLTGQNFNTSGAQTNQTILHSPPFPTPPTNYKNNSYLIHAAPPISHPSPNPSFGWETVQNDHGKTPGFPPPPSSFRLRDPRLYPDHPVSYARLKSNGQGLISPPRPTPTLAGSYYYGPTTISKRPPQHQHQHDHHHHSEEYHQSPTPPPPPNYSRRGPPSFSNFMNGLMNSVSEFFGRIG